MAEPARKRSSRRSGNLRASDVARTGKGVSDDDVRAVFEFLDPRGTGYVTATSLASKLKVFFPDFTPKDYKELLNGKKRLSFEELKAILTDNQLDQSDCMHQAFQLFDCEERGYITPDRLSVVFAQLNGRELTPQELRHLHSYADRDKDGRITLEDFRHIMVLPGVMPATNGHSTRTDQAQS